MAIMAAVSLGAAAETFEADGLWYETTGESTVILIAPPDGTSYTGAVTVVPKVSHGGTEYTLQSITPDALRFSIIESLTLADGFTDGQITSIQLQNCSSLTRLNIGSYYPATGPVARSINLGEKEGVIDAAVRECDGKTEVVVSRFEIYDTEGTKLTPSMRNFENANERITADANGIIKLGVPLSEVNTLTNFGLLTLRNAIHSIDFLIPNPAGDGEIDVRININAYKTGDYIEDGGLRYSLLGDKAYVYTPAPGKEYSGDIILPETVTDGTASYHVYGIAPHAFYLNGWTREGVTSVKFNAGMTDVSMYAFENCGDKLEYVDMTACKNLEIKAGPIFNSCRGLKRIDCPALIMSNSEILAHYCNSLTTITLVEGSDVGNILTPSLTDNIALYDVELLRATDTDVTLRIRPTKGGGVCTSAGVPLPIKIDDYYNRGTLYPDADGIVTMPRSWLYNSGGSRYGGDFFIGYDNRADKYLKSCGFFTTYRLPEEQLAAVAEVTAAGSDAPAEYFDLHGRRVAEPSAPGLYIRRQGTAATKVIIK